MNTIDTLIEARHLNAVHIGEAVKFSTLITGAKIQADISGEIRYITHHPDRTVITVASLVEYENGDNEDFEVSHSTPLTIIGAHADGANR